MNKEVLVIGYGSVGKRHVNNLIELGIHPLVLTKYPDNVSQAKFIDKLDEKKNIGFAIIATPTNRHMEDFLSLVKHTNCKNILIEKPLDSCDSKAQEILNISRENKIEVFVAYNLRFLKVFNVIHDVISANYNKIRLVHISAGQYLPDWRPARDYRKSYSASRKDGGGVDLDLSHEVDYMLWCFGFPASIDSVVKHKLSSLEIDSPDYFNATYFYKNFVIFVELDYFRKKQRFISIKGENEEILYSDFINSGLSIYGQDCDSDSLFDFNQSYVMELKEFLNLSKRIKLCTLEESIKVISLLAVKEENV